MRVAGSSGVSYCPLPFLSGRPSNRVPLDLSEHKSKDYYGGVRQHVYPVRAPSPRFTMKLLIDIVIGGLALFGFVAFVGWCWFITRVK